MVDREISKAASIMAQKSGRKRLETGGREIFSKMGKITAKRHGRAYYQELNRKSQEAKRRKKLASDL